MATALFLVKYEGVVKQPPAIIGEKKIRGPGMYDKKIPKNIFEETRYKSTNHTAILMLIYARG